MGERKRVGSEKLGKGREAKLLHIIVLATVGDENLNTVSCSQGFERKVPPADYFLL
jgi:hypothetical protein